MMANKAEIYCNKMYLITVTEILIEWHSLLLYIWSVICCVSNGLINRVFLNRTVLYELCPLGCWPCIPISTLFINLSHESWCVALNTLCLYFFSAYMSSFSSVLTFFNYITVTKPATQQGRPFPRPAGWPTQHGERKCRCVQCTVTPETSACDRHSIFCSWFPLL